MAIDSLLEKLQVRADTPDTSRNGHDVSPKAALTLACTFDTPDTSQITNTQSKKSHDIEKEIKREERRQKVLAMLEDQPGTERVVVTDTSIDPNNVILTIGIRNQYTFEMLISKHRYDGLALLEMLHNLSKAISINH